MGENYEGNLKPGIFGGVYFTLVGFSSSEEANVRSKLTTAGGVDAGEYCYECTHVIVDNDKVVYDDKRCVAARNDRKSLVNKIWVDHSLEAEEQVPLKLTSSILYRPLKDLNGIEGAKDLTVCLTGYVGHLRGDVERMVHMMGANFSKSLTANHATHLVCYKFEGEKYKHARKYVTIKLVNHLWLEDCLINWKIEPAGCYPYTMSGEAVEEMKQKSFADRAFEVMNSDDEAKDDTGSGSEGANSISPGRKRFTPVKRGRAAAESSSKLQEGSDGLNRGGPKEAGFSDTDTPYPYKRAKDSTEAKKSHQDISDVVSQAETDRNTKRQIYEVAKRQYDTKCQTYDEVTARLSTLAEIPDDVDIDDQKIIKAMQDQTDAMMSYDKAETDFMNAERYLTSLQIMQVFMDTNGEAKTSHRPFA